MFINSLLSDPRVLKLKSKKELRNSAQEPDQLGNCMWAICVLASTIQVSTRLYAACRCVVQVHPMHPSPPLQTLHRPYPRTMPASTPVLVSSAAQTCSLDTGQRSSSSRCVRNLDIQVSEKEKEVTFPEPRPPIRLLPNAMILLSHSTKIGFVVVGGAVADKTSASRASPMPAAMLLLDPFRLLTGSAGPGIAPAFMFNPLTLGDLDGGLPGAGVWMSRLWLGFIAMRPATDITAGWKQGEEERG